MTHDYLFIAWQLLEGPGPRDCDRKFADDLMYAGMKAAKVSAWRRLAIYLALRVGGRWTYQRNGEGAANFGDVTDPRLEHLAAIPSSGGRKWSRCGFGAYQLKRKIKMRLLLALAALTLAACTGKPSFDESSLSDEKLNLEEFFDGELTAYGQFQDILGTVRRSFVVSIDGDWDGERLRLVEDFIYEDGATEQRIWTLVKTGPDSWDGTASGVIGIATGVEQDNRFNWKYEIDLPVPSADGTVETIRVTFDDWMWLLSEDRLLNRAYVKRYGLDIGDVIITFEK